MNNVLSILYPKFQQSIEALQKWSHEHLWVYDIETYPNLLTIGAINAQTHQTVYFEFSPFYSNVHDFSRWMYHLNVNKAEMVGFNNQHFDFPVINYVFHQIPAGLTNQGIFNLVTSIFDAEFEDRFNHVIWSNDQYIRQIDLFKINHYDNMSKSTSLKMLENNLGMNNIQELPIKPGTVVNAEQREQLYQYLWHDVAATMLFLSKNMAQIDLRRTLTERFNHNFINASDAKIGADIVKLELKKAGLNLYKKTPRDSISFKECIFEYVHFERPEFQAVHNWLCETTITQTKEALNEIDVPWSLVQYMNPNEIIVHGIEPAVLAEMKLRKGAKVKLSLIPECTVLTDCVFIANHLHVVVDGFQFDFGTGGIHGSISSSIVKTNSTHKLIDVDVASYYPNLAIKNKIFPEHLGVEYCEVNQRIYDMRKQHPKSTHLMENLAFKLALNAGYGNSNSKYSFLYDPKFTITTTINGQLLLCMLSEHLLKVPGLSIIQINTDGVTYFCPNEYIDHTMSLCRWWESITDLVLEDVTYEAMYIRDVNNYIAIDNRSKRKYKGAYEHNLVDQWHKNFNMRIVGMAAEAALCDGETVEEFINQRFGNDEYREFFTMRSKVDRNTNVVLHVDGVDKPMQRITRYYAAKEGGKLVKIMQPTTAQLKAWNEGDHYMHEDTHHYVCKKVGVKPPSGKYKPVAQHERRVHPERRISIESTCLIADCNNMNDFDWSNLNIDFYIGEANKLVVPLLQ